MATVDDEEIVDYGSDLEENQPSGGDGKEIKKGHYVGIHTSNFNDFILKPELLRAIVDCGFEHPSEGTVSSFPNSIWKK